jgi:uncharacterized phage-associated protein
MKDAITIANAILKLSEPEIGDAITNLKLQKLLYYIQGFHLALHDEPLFKEDVLAWEHGPVVKEVYHKFSGCGANSIEVPEEGVELTKKERDVVIGVWKVYGQFSAWKLRDMTHGEKPWRETPRNGVISHDLLKKFFKTLVVA